MYKNVVTETFPNRNGHTEMSRDRNGSDRNDLDWNGSGWNSQTETARSNRPDRNVLFRLRRTE